jgi:3-oxoacyl-[acyl-carrier protein] reductase
MNKKKVLVTGGTRGIGKSIFELFKKNGYDVYITGTSLSKIPNEKYYQVDFSNSESFEKFIFEISSKKFDILINNVGTNIIKNQSDVSIVEWSKMIDVNLKSIYFISQSILKNMPSGGKIINISSIFGVVSKELRSLYSTTKFGINGLTKSLSLEYAHKNILINSISPGFTNTELTSKSLTEEQSSELKKQVPLNRFAEPNEIAELVFFLSSEKNSYITGQNIIIDGGFTIK